MSRGKRKVIPKEFFVTSGKAVSPISELNAFDLALKNAGIAQCNLVSVSSVLPPGCREIKLKRMPIGSITHAVVARMSAEGEATIGAGIVWAWEKDKRYGIVAEAHGCMDQKALGKTLEWKIREMAKIREIELEKINHRTETLKVPANDYGCVIAALIYVL